MIMDFGRHTNGWSSAKMLFSALLVVGCHLSFGLGLQSSQSGAFNFRHYCTIQHSMSKYKVSCDGSKHFKNKNLILDSQSAFGITEMKLNSFERITIISQTQSDWDKVQKIAISGCKKVEFYIQSNLKLNQLEVDSVDELTLETDQPAFSVVAQMILLSNIGKLNLTYSKNAEIKASILSIINITDVNFYKNLKFSGEMLTISHSNIDLTDDSTLFLNFASVTVKDSTKLYIQQSGQLNISINKCLFQESYIFTYGKLNITGNNFFGNQNIIKFFNNSFYEMKKTHLHISGDKNVVEFIENDISTSDIGDVLGLVGDTEDMAFKNNHFGCNKCGKTKTLHVNNLKYLGDQNFCDVTCNLTLTRYKELLDQGVICNEDDTFVDEQALCSNYSEATNTKSDSVVTFWTLVPVIVVTMVFLFILLYFYCKRHSPRFKSMSVENSVVLPQEQQSSQENQKVVFRAFNNELYEHVGNNSENAYETVDEHSLRTH